MVVWLFTTEVVVVHTGQVVVDVPHGVIDLDNIPGGEDGSLSSTDELVDSDE